jgi:transcriptional regulator with XRE-family HTH domain
MNTISEIIASLRKSKGMTQEALANILGVSPQTVSKWETGSTMPDILLLPMIAEVFGITIDALFGIKYLEPQKQYTKETFHEEMYSRVCRGFTDFWRDTEDTLSPEERTANHRQYLLDHPAVQSAILANHTGNGVYANSDLAVIFRREESTIQDLLEDENAWTVLKRFTDGETRTVFRFLVQNPCKSFTASLLAAKCNIDVKLAERALNNLLCMNLLSRNDVDTGDGILYVYRAWGTHKLLLVYTMLSIASRLGNYREMYRGFLN